ncbi:MAG: nuclear transport factor 2 family protein [Frankia sp.]
MDADDLTYLVDREKIRDCLARVARGEDRRDAALISGAYWPDATDDHGISQGTFEEYLAWVVPGAPSIPNTLHTLGQSLIEVTGDKALAETHVTAYHRIDMGEAEVDIVIGGRYLDQLEKRDQEWRIAHRTMLYDWLKDWGGSVDWSQGVLGMPFLADHYVGKANGDHSVSVFEQYSS